jgi:hypothetical protein
VIAALAPVPRLRTGVGTPPGTRGGERELGVVWFKLCWCVCDTVCVCAVAHPRHRAPLLSPPCTVHTVISALLHVRWLCAVREVRCGAGRCGCPCVCVAGHVHGASDGHGSPWAQPPPLPVPLPADSRWCVVASMAGGLRRATPGAAEVSEAVFLCVVLSLLCRGVWVCGWHPPPQGAVCHWPRTSASCNPPPVHSCACGGRMGSAAWHAALCG